MSADAHAGQTVERRLIQRIFTAGQADAVFCCEINGQRWPLLDLSLVGFALPVAAAPQDQHFVLTLSCAGKAETIKLSARVVNRLSSSDGEQVGCLFEPMTDEHASLIKAWLVEYVLHNATVPIDEADAVRIVTGPSLI